MSSLRPLPLEGDVIFDSRPASPPMLSVIAEVASFVPPEQTVVIGFQPGSGLTGSEGGLVNVVNPFCFVDLVLGLEKIRDLRETRLVEHHVLIREEAILPPLAEPFDESNNRRRVVACHHPPLRQAAG